MAEAGSGAVLVTMALIFPVWTVLSPNNSQGTDRSTVSPQKRKGG